VEDVEEQENLVRSIRYRDVGFSLANTPSRRRAGEGECAKAAGYARTRRECGERSLTSDGAGQEREDLQASMDEIYGRGV